MFPDCYIIDILLSTMLNHFDGIFADTDKKYANLKLVEKFIHYFVEKIIKMDSTYIIRAIQDIKSTPSITKKLKLLKEYGAELGDVWPEILHKTYDPKFRYGIKWVPDEPAHGTWDFFENTLDVLALIFDIDNGLYGREGIIPKLKEKLNQPTYDVVRLILMKDLDCGINVATINKVYPGLIREPAYMRCSLPKKKDLDKWPWATGVFVQEKMDGMFVSVTQGNGEIYIVSRSGEQFPMGSLPEIEKQAEIMLMIDERLEGELVLYKNGVEVDRQTGNGALNSLRQGNKKALDGYTAVFVPWDMVDKYSDEYTPYKDRLLGLNARLLSLYEKIGADNTLIRFINQTTVFTLDEAVEFTKNLMARGKEGAVLKHPEGIWRNGTSKHQVKLKVEVECDVKVTGFVDGTKGSKTASTFGALCYESADGLVKGSVSGFTDKQRQEIHENRDNWIGAVIAVKANALTRAKDTDHYALSHPRFVERRHDKHEADDLKRIQESFDNFLIGGV